MSKIGKLIVVAVLCAGLLVGLWYIKSHALNFYAYGESVRVYIKELVKCCPIRALLLYVSLYTCCAILSVPILMPLALFGGMLFGTVIGGISAIIASTAGALISFLLIKNFFLPFMNIKYGIVSQEMSEWIGKRGVFGALVILHLLSVVPYVVINTIAALLGVSVPLFIAAALFGSTPVMFVYAFAGAQFGMLQSIGDIFSPAFLAACVLLVCCIVLPPFFYKKNRKTTTE